MCIRDRASPWARDQAVSTTSTSRMHTCFASYFVPGTKYMLRINNIEMIVASSQHHVILFSWTPLSKYLHFGLAPHTPRHILSLRQQNPGVLCEALFCILSFLKMLAYFAHYLVENSSACHNSGLPVQEHVWSTLSSNSGRVCRVTCAFVECKKNVGKKEGSIGLKICIACVQLWICGRVRAQASVI